MSRLFATLVAFLLFANVGIAGERSDAASPLWAGLYVGGYVEHHDFRLGRLNDPLAAPAVITKLKDKGHGFGAVFGISIPVPDSEKVMAGIEADLYWPRLNTTAIIANGTFEENIASSAGGGGGCLSGALRFRLGLEVFQGGLIYGAAGPALLCLNLATAFAGSAGSDRVYLWGVQLGGGLEYWLNRWIGLRAEYLYSNYEKKTVVALAPHIFELNPHGHALRAYLVLKIPGS